MAASQRGVLLAVKYIEYAALTDMFWSRCSGRKALPR